MITRDQAIEIATRLVEARIGKDCPLLDVRRTGDFWMVSFEYEQGLDPSLLIRVDASTGEAVQESLL
jgi:hypothetical protein